MGGGSGPAGGDRHVSVLFCGECVNGTVSVKICGNQMMKIVALKVLLRRSRYVLLTSRLPLGGRNKADMRWERSSKPYT